VTGQGLRGRRRARLMLAIGAGHVAFVALMFVAQPNYIGPMRFGPPSVFEWLMPAIGATGVLVGFGWMIRIYRAEPEAHPSFWRSQRS
jgi:hypothetical protein